MRKCDLSTCTVSDLAAINLKTVKFQLIKLLAEREDQITWMVRLGESNKVVLIKAFLDAARRDHEARCYRRLRSAQGVFVPKLLRAVCRPPWPQDDRRHALMLSWIGPLWRLDCRPLSAGELLAVRGDVLRMHALGVVHRDLWPRNLVRDGAGKVFVVDFDMARVAPMTPCVDGAFEEECALERDMLRGQIQSAESLEDQAGRAREAV